MMNWRRDEARRKAREKLQRAEERRAADRWAKIQAATRRLLAQQEQAFKASGCETREEFEELLLAKNESRAQEQAERDERQRAYVEPFVELEHGMPDALDVAFAMSQRHAGGAAVSLAETRSPKPAASAFSKAVTTSHRSTCLGQSCASGNSGPWGMTSKEAHFSGTTMRSSGSRRAGFARGLFPRCCAYRS